MTTSPASVHVPPVRAEGRPLIVRVGPIPGPDDHHIVLSDASLERMRGLSVPLLADGPHASTVGRATVQRAAMGADGRVAITATVEARPDAPEGYLDALRSDPRGEMTLSTWHPGGTGTAVELRPRSFWPGPGKPAAPADPFHRVTVACTSCSRTVADACQDEIESGLCLRCLNGPILPDEAQREEARALFAEHGPADPAVAPDADVLWTVLNAATPETRAWLLERIGGGARCFVENHDRAIQHWQAEAARAREDAEGYDGILTRQGDLLTRTVNALKGPPPPLTTWSHHDVPEVAAEVVAERDRLRAEVHALERPHLCVASGMPVGRCRDTDLCDCFGGQTVMQRLMAAEGDAMALAERVRVLAETWDTQGAGITSWTRAAADLRSTLDRKAG